MWILKPANLCQGKGIIITGNIDLIGIFLVTQRKRFDRQKNSLWCSGTSKTHICWMASNLT